MRLLLCAVMWAALPAADAAPPRRVVFEGANSEHKWTLKELDPSLPADWSAQQFLVLEFRSSTAQRFELRVFNQGSARRLRIRPFQGVWIRAAVPLVYFLRPNREGTDLASLGNKPRAGYSLNLGGPYGPLNAVDAVGVAMQNPLGKPVLEIRSVGVAKESPGDAILEPKPLVDQFGQWIPEEWPGKAHSLEDLKAAWAAEEKTLGGGTFDYCPYGGYRSTRARATGFFRVEQVDGRWWFIDPDGHYFYSAGATCIRPHSGTRTEGREGVFAALPPPELTGFSGREGASFFTWNLARRHGAGWLAKWIDLTARRMEAWGLNTVANWSDPHLWDAHRKAYVVNLRSWSAGGPAYMGLPDVFSDDFARRADKAAAEQCASRKNDPWLLGYFIANEPPWPGRESLVADAILEGPDSATRRELNKALAAGDTPERRKAFLYRAFERYLEVINAALKRHDPNHLNLGIRFGGANAPEEMVRACRGFDVYSINNYNYAINPADIERGYRITGRPTIIGEFHFGVPGRGLSAGLRQTRDQTERGAAYRYYVENAAAMPTLIGTHWFQWVDQPNTGRFDGENYNIGLVDVADRPYTELIEAMRATHRRLLAVHSGKEPPVTRKAEVQ